MLGRMAEYLARVQLTIWAERANPNKKLKFSQSIFNIFNMTFYGKWFWMVRGGYWSLKSLSFIQFDLWNLNLKISLLAWDWCAISSEMRNRKKTNSNIVTRCQKYLSRKVSVWHFWKKIGRLVSCQKKVTLLPLNYLGLLSQSWLTLPWQHLVLTKGTKIDLFSTFTFANNVNDLFSRFVAKNKLKLTKVWIFAPKRKFLPDIFSNKQYSKARKS